MIQNTRIPLILPGSVGEPKIIRALIGNPDLQVQKTTVYGYGLGIQPIQYAKPEYVKDIIERNWTRKGKKYPGAITYFKSEKDEAPGHLVFLTPKEWLRFNGRSGFWNMHADRTQGEKPEEGWYRPFVIPGEACPGAGVPRILTEILVNQEGLRRLPNSYVSYETNPEYRAFVDEMTNQVVGENEWPEIGLDLEAKRLHSSSYGKERRA